MRFASILLATHTFLSNVIQRARQYLYLDILFLNNFLISLTPWTSLKELYWSAASIVNKKFWLNPNLYPRWVDIGSVFSIALPYNYGAVSKFLAAGVNWRGGLSLELWVSLMADPDFILSEFILSDRENAHLLQRGVTIVQSFALLALIPHLRSVIGLGLIAFQLSVELTFGTPFRGNIVLLAVFFLPWFGVFGGLVVSLKKSDTLKRLR